MRHTRDPGHHALHAHAKSGVRERSVFPNVEIPLERFDRKVALLQPLQQQIVIVDALTAAYQFLTSKDEEIDELMGLNAGADDYIRKPFSQRLLLERVKAVLRRAEGKKGAAASQSDGKQIMTRGKLTLDPLRHECMWDGKPVRLTVTEFLILQSLAQRPGFVKSRDNLMDAAYDDQVYVDDRTIDSHIKRLRKKFKAVDDSFDSIETLYGVGYRYKEG